jgi:hypothetical protein
MSLPWAPPTLSQRPALPPVRADRVRGSACAKGADAGISRGLGISATARIRNAGGRFTAGRRHGGRPNIARTPMSKPSTPRLSARAASGPSPHLRLFKNQRLRQRVVTRHILFFPSHMRPARLPRLPHELGPKPGTLLLPRLPSGGSHSPGSGTQVVLSRHIGWPYEAGLRVSSRAPAPLCAAMRRLHPNTVAGTSAVMIPPECAGRQLSHDPCGADYLGLPASFPGAQA